MKSYKGKKILVTGHTGFKGTWLSRTLLELGAEIFGIGLDEGSDKLFSISNTGKDMQSHICDIRDKDTCDKIMKEINPDLVFHLAAQALVLKSYTNPIETFDTNLMGTINILEICRSLENLQAIVCITTDKVYHNYEWAYPYRENDRLGGYDPYSASKAMCELAINSYQYSFYKEKGIPLTSVRAGNVIGGGDFSANRIIPDIVRAIQSNQAVSLRNPYSVRPWQHVMDAIMGYLLIGKYLFKNKTSPSSAYNIAPIDNTDTYTVEYLVRLFIEVMQQGSYSIEETPMANHEMKTLRLDPSLIIAELGWQPIFNTEEAIQQTAEEYSVYLRTPELFNDKINTTIRSCLSK